MPAQIVFLTLFLGIASGKQPLSLEATGPVQSIRVLLAGHEIARLTRPPWSTNIDLGSDLTPRELTAISYDGNGNEVARANQVINLPRPLAEFDIILDGNDVSLRWKHLMNLAPTKAALTFDDKPLSLDAGYRAKLPAFNRAKDHVVGAELRFADGFTARREALIEAELSASVSSQLSPVLLRDTGKPHPRTWERCLTRADGSPVRVASFEKPPALVIAVRDPFPPAERDSPLDLWLSSLRRNPEWSIKNTTEFDRTTAVRIMWAVSQRFNGDDATADLFEATQDFDASLQFKHTNGNALYMMYTDYSGPLPRNTPRQFADAVAVGGIRAIESSLRRVVVYLPSLSEDTSRSSPEAVRRYLQSLGVPFFVWSRGLPYPVVNRWGTIEDISKYDRLANAVARVRRELETQRVAWVDVDPLEALHLHANPQCGIDTLARP